ncbi:MAG: FHA domain-containing protein [Oscillospiraceae bacterium]|nr:FHA domain-containing protein [Oscillospiraceae bacterium]
MSIKKVLSVNQLNYIDNSKKIQLKLNPDCEILEYQIEMASTNKIDGLLPFIFQKTDGKPAFTYDINGFVPISGYLMDRQADIHEIAKILMDITKTITELKKYLLEESNVLLDAEFVFIEPEKRVIRLIYLPVGNLDAMENKFSSFTIGLLGRIDTNSSTEKLFCEKIVEEVKKLGFNYNDFNNFLLDILVFSNERKDVRKSQDIDDDNSLQSAGSNRRAGQYSYPLEGSSRVRDLTGKKPVIPALAAYSIAIVFLLLAYLFRRYNVENHTYLTAVLMVAVGTELLLMMKMLPQGSVVVERGVNTIFGIHSAMGSSMKSDNTGTSEKINESKSKKSSFITGLNPFLNSEKKRFDNSVNVVEQIYKDRQRAMEQSQKQLSATNENLWSESIKADGAGSIQAEASMNQQRDYTGAEPLSMGQGDNSGVEPHSMGQDEYYGAEQHSMQHGSFIGAEPHSIGQDDYTGTEPHSIGQGYYTGAGPHSIWQGDYTGAGSHFVRQDGFMGAESHSTHQGDYSGAELLQAGSNEAVRPLCMEQNSGDITTAPPQTGQSGGDKRAVLQPEQSGSDNINTPPLWQSGGNADANQRITCNHNDVISQSNDKDSHNEVMFQLHEDSECNAPHLICLEGGKINSHPDEADKSDRAAPWATISESDALSQISSYAAQSKPRLIRVEGGASERQLERVIDDDDDHHRHHPHHHKVFLFKNNKETLNNPALSQGGAESYDNHLPAHADMGKQDALYTPLASDWENGVTEILSTKRQIAAKLFIKDSLREYGVLLKNNEFVIGRLKDKSDLVLNNKAIGKVHAKLEQSDNTWIIRDMNSKNGTYINNIRLECGSAKPLNNYDTITIANIDLIFILQPES